MCDVASRSDIYSAGTLTAVLLSELGVVAFSMAVVIRLITPRVICLSLQTTEPYSSAFKVITIFSLLWPQISICWLVDEGMLAKGKGVLSVGGLHNGKCSRVGWPCKSMVKSFDLGGEASV